jgi:hypothetical protein
MFDTFEILMFALWTCFAVYATWYFTSAKHYAPITHDEARTLWKIHKQIIRCDGRKWREIRHGNKVVGFQCECGYRHIQKRPIVVSAPIANTQAQNSQVSIFDKLHTSYE